MFILHTSPTISIQTEALKWMILSRHICSNSCCTHLWTPHNWEFARITHSVPQKYGYVRILSLLHLAHTRDPLPLKRPSMLTSIKRFYYRKNCFRRKPKRHNVKQHLVVSLLLHGENLIFRCNRGGLSYCYWGELA